MSGTLGFECFDRRIWEVWTFELVLSIEWADLESIPACFSDINVGTPSYQWSTQYICIFFSLGAIGLVDDYSHKGLQTFKQPAMICSHCCSGTEVISQWKTSNLSVFMALRCEFLWRGADFLWMCCMLGEYQPSTRHNPFIIHSYPFS